ncbi:cold shock domain-containing protein E1-like [Lingula anatina]|uniref:Cold shock domain-containing protein E1-like n=1 Tax=Lingula anatina TaxID=7574 RepID=A0A1S3JNQ2_LINAN|nr:cold shock domain-containing protein E1-like [Lingula anatina]XP_013412005.1 cold shock domain-containing protein E1-like [Lingula anatina]|eukprot:XP_013412003.1 cold shock domain-containing protein E1-like [Lingula anatina]
MATPQVKAFPSPPAHDPAILAFERSTAGTTNGNYGNIAVQQQPGSNNNLTSGIRETGIVEKLLHSYGFIQCCERDARLFFHFSEYNGDVDNMKIGDAVEFYQSYDKRTGKPIACGVVKSDSSEISYEILSAERINGTVAAEAKPVNRRHSLTGVGPQDGLGRVSYENSGEWFFVPFGQEDVEDGFKLKPGDKVTFFLATDKRNGNIRAKKIQVVQERYQGVVCSMKDSFGFIERADVVREIFFHYSEYQNDINELILGDDVDFSVQIRNGKEVAVDIRHLAEGTVIFEDVSLETTKGKIQKTLKNSHNRRQSDPLAGRIVYQAKTGSVEIPYGDKDQKGDYTLQCGDLVEFNIATDRRDKLQRGTNIRLLEETFKVNAEKREYGVVVTLKEGYGFIKCADRDARMFFHFSERLDPDSEINLQDETEFTVIQDPSSPSRHIAIRIKQLPKGTISFESVSKDKYIGVVEKEPATHKSPSKNKEANDLFGLISYEHNGTKQTISYLLKSITDMRNIPKYGDKVEFHISEVKRNSSRTAVNIRVLSRNSTPRQQGFIATLKDNFGFIENAEHDREIFFHYSAVEGDPCDLDLGDEVEFVITKKSTKVSAENIRKLPKGTVAVVANQPGMKRGKIIRPMRIVNPDQDEYCGIVQVGTDDDPSAEKYPYGITSLADKRDFLQKGDIVKFQICTVKGTNKKMATNVAAERKYIRAHVDSVKGQYGFLTYEAEESKKLFFHMTEVHDGVELQPGDEVEFVVVQNQRNGKYSACSLRKICETRRPERLLSRLKSVSEDSGQRVTVVRQPKGPDGTKGFKQQRVKWTSPV